MEKKFKFEKLIIWEKAMELGEQINKMTNDFPNKEKYNLSSQIRRAEAFRRKLKNNIVRLVSILESRFIVISKIFHFHTSYFQQQ